MAAHNGPANTKDKCRGILVSAVFLPFLGSKGASLNNYLLVGCGYFADHIVSLT
jgi:hypothetical protein